MDPSQDPTARIPTRSDPGSRIGTRTPSLPGLDPGPSFQERRLAEVHKTFLDLRHAERQVAVLQKEAARIQGIPAEKRLWESLEAFSGKARFGAPAPAPEARPQKRPRPEEPRAEAPSPGGPPPLTKSARKRMKERAREAQRKEGPVEPGEIVQKDTPGDKTELSSA